MTHTQTWLLSLIFSASVHIDCAQFVASYTTSNTTGQKSQDNAIIYNKTLDTSTNIDSGSMTLASDCDVQLCISKCCAENHSQNDTCELEWTNRANVDVYHDNSTLAEANVPHVSTHTMKCSPVIDLDSADTFYIKTDGRLHFDNKDYALYEYCVAQDEENETVVRLCLGREDDNVSHTKYGMLVSVPFLFATLVVYLILPDKKIQTKCLMAYVTCLMMAYIFLIYIQFNKLGSPVCEIIGACGIYFFMATFCWMNITCVDMYFIFSGIRAPLQRKSSEWKRFAMYVVFANGTPLILLAVIFGINSLDAFSGHPQFGIRECWVGSGLPVLIYFNGPMAILLTINTILFVLTMYKIRTAMKDNKKMLRGKESSRSNEANKQDYIMYVKLFLIMGISWMMEFISWLVNWLLGVNKVEWIWYPTDFCNAIYGVLIFVIFVWKKAILIKLKQRYYIFMGKPNMARALSTQASGYQMSQTERTNAEESTAKQSSQVRSNVI